MAAASSLLLQSVIGYCLAVGVAATAPASGDAAVNASQPVSSAPATRPVEFDATAAHEALVQQLGDNDYRRREEADRKLRGLGEAALPVLLAHVTDPDREISARVESILPFPSEPEARIHMAVVLIDTGRAPLVRKAVEVLFVDPRSVHEQFLTAAAASSARVKVAAEQIDEQMRAFLSYQAQNEKLIESLIEKGQSSNVSTWRNNVESQRRGLAYVASEFAWEAVEDLGANPPKDKPRVTSSQPARP